MKMHPHVYLGFAFYVIGALLLALAVVAWLTAGLFVALFLVGCALVPFYQGFQLMTGRAAKRALSDVEGAA